MGRIITIKGEGGFNRKAPSNDSGAGFIFAAGQVRPVGFPNTAQGPFTSIEQVEALGITQEYDTNNSVLIWEHLSRFWHYSPNAQVWIGIAAQGTSMSDMVDTTGPYLNGIIALSEGKAKTIGVVMNPAATGYVPVLAGGMDQDSLDAIPKAQATIEQHAAQYRNVMVVIEGRSLTGTAGAMEDLRLNDAGGVIVTVLQDPAVAGKETIHAGYADVGTTVGIISRSAVHENGGWTEKFNLQSKAKGYYLQVSISDMPVFSREAEFDQLTQKGVTFGRTYPQQAGVYLEDSPTCGMITSDYAYWTETRVMNKAIIAVYNALFPKINGPIKVDAETGRLDLEVVKSFEALGQAELDYLETLGEISGGESYIDANQDLKAQGKLINNIRVVSIDTGRVIEVQIGFTKKIG